MQHQYPTFELPSGHMHAIWAQSRDGVIGNGDDMPWMLPEDLAHFRRTTGTSAVLMGRATWESLPAAFRPLPQRTNIVVSSRQPGPWSQGAQVVGDLPRDFAGWIIGGGQIYRQALPYCHSLVVTQVGCRLANEHPDDLVTAPAIPADFQLVSASDWQLSARGTLTADYLRPEPDTGGLSYRFCLYQRS